MKLNTKRTIFVGFAFFLICAFWQAYEAIVPLMLVNKFGMNQLDSGIIMSIDNILALVMLPLFGALSDKKKNARFGKRTPFILIGTVVAIVCFIGLTFADNAQLSKVTEGTNDIYWEANYTIENNEYERYTNNQVPTSYTVRDYASQILFGKNYADLTASQQQEAKTWYLGLNADSLYFYDKTDYKVIDLPGTDTEQNKEARTELIAQMTDNGFANRNAFSVLVNTARSHFAAEVTQGQWWILFIFIVLLLFTLIAMATFRSPAVALMPDVVVKPLRSKANAIINLMGTAGGILVLVLGMIFATDSPKNSIMSYTGFVIAVCGIMLVALVAFMLLVKEKKWNAEMLEQQAELDAKAQQENPETDSAPAVEKKLSKEQFRSLLLILFSVALWFTGYNAITSKFTLYAMNVLEAPFNTTLLIAQGAAIVAFIPVGIVASKVGRKKTIMFGITLVTLCFVGGALVNKSTPPFVMYILFAVVGIAWASINVNSFPMVVELSQGGSIGKYTGYYYTASMAAQILTPILSGWLMDMLGSMWILFPYGALFVGLSFVTMFFVKYGDSKPEVAKDKLEMLGGADD